VEQVEARALERTIEKGVVSRERVLAEWARIAFFDLRRAVSWTGSTVTLENSDELDDDTAMAISEVRQGKDGVSIKAADRIAALTALSKHLGLFADEDKTPPTNVTNVTNNLMILEGMSKIERVRRVATMLRRAAKAKALEEAKAIEAKVIDVTPSPNGSKPFEPDAYNEALQRLHPGPAA
jgi:hypothetical protein